MSTYVIGDLQGCWRTLQRLLEKIAYSPENDTLYFVGDLINRGPDSLQCLRWIHSAGSNVFTVLGNHDLAAAAMWYQKQPPMKTLEALWAAEDAETLFDWLCQQPLLHLVEAHQCVIVHAGLPPDWSLSTAQMQANAVESVLRQSGPTRALFFRRMWGNTPACWSDCHTSVQQQRFTVNALTRMRMLNQKGCLDFSWKGGLEEAPVHLSPWFSRPMKMPQGWRIVFGHWAALNGETGREDIIAVDTGCVWGGALTAYRLEDGRKFSVPSEEKP